MSDIILLHELRMITNMNSKPSDYNWELFLTENNDKHQTQKYFGTLAITKFYTQNILVIEKFLVNIHWSFNMIGSPYIKNRKELREHNNTDGIKNDQNTKYVLLRWKGIKRWGLLPFIFISVGFSFASLQNSCIKSSFNFIV